MAYLFIIGYATVNYNKEENIYFQILIYIYAALLGIQILQAGNYISEFGFSAGMVLIINCCNLISFANTIKFADKLDNKKMALAYMWIAVILKTIIEILLIISMFKYIQPIHILISLSIPILGIIIIVAYLHRYYVRNINK